MSNSRLQLIEQINELDLELSCHKKQMAESKSVFFNHFITFLLLITPVIVFVTPRKHLKKVAYSAFTIVRILL
jgi:hypothetical protein